MSQGWPVGQRVGAFSSHPCRGLRGPQRHDHSPNYEAACFPLEHQLKEHRNGGLRAPARAWQGLRGLHGKPKPGVLRDSGTTPPEHRGCQGPEGTAGPGAGLFHVQPRTGQPTRGGVTGPPAFGASCGRLLIWLLFSFHHNVRDLKAPTFPGTQPLTESEEVLIVLSGG